MYKYRIFLVSIALSLTCLGFAQESSQVKNQVVKGYQVETGYFFNGQPYAKVGTGNKVIIDIEALSWDHSPPEGFLLKLFIQQSELFLDDYTVYKIGRRPNLPQGYSHDNISKEYGALISRVFKTKVDIVGQSTGGQIGLCLLANFPDLINKAVIISAAHKVSEEGKVLEKKSAEYYKQKKYGKSMATFADIVYDKGFKRSFYKPLMYVMGRSMMKDVEYPADFQVEVLADCNMDFSNRLTEIKTPTLVISGKKDIGYSIEDIKLTAAGISNSKLLVYDDYGHNLYSDNYKEVNEAILSFLK